MTGTRVWPLIALATMLAGCGPPVSVTSSPSPPVAMSLETVSTTAVDSTVATTRVVRLSEPLVGWSSASISERGPIGPSPNRLAVPSLGIDAPVIAVGVDQAGTMDVPSNVTEVAWYRFGARPGEPGAAVLAAHVDLAGSGPGVFFHLDRLQVDDLVVVQFEDDSVRSFTVVAAERVPKTDLDLEVLFSRSGSPIVYLVTCGGAFNPQIRRYDDNVVVTLTPAEGRSG